jgi:hypothetical protein
MENRLSKLQRGKQAGISFSLQNNLQYLVVTKILRLNTILIFCALALSLLLIQKKIGTDCE